MRECVIEARTSSKVKAERSRLKGANLERSESLGAIHLFGNVKENCLLG
jgi:hypothetical protein